jgi:hypothetical protein
VVYTCWCWSSWVVLGRLWCSDLAIWSRIVLGTSGNIWKGFFYTPSFPSVYGIVNVGRPILQFDSYVKLRLHVGQFVGLPPPWLLGGAATGIVSSMHLNFGCDCTCSYFALINRCSLICFSRVLAAVSCCLGEFCLITRCSLICWITSCETIPYLMYTLYSSVVNT